MRAIYGLSPDPDAAQRAVQGLRNSGVADSNITVISSEPFEEYEFSHRDSATWIYYIAGVAGVCGLLFAVWLTSMTEKAWPLPTGGMPIVALWPNMIVIFEVTMLSAILATVVTLLITAKMPRQRPFLYDPAVSEGHILVGVEGGAARGDLRQVLDAEGASSVRTID